VEIIQIAFSSDPSKVNIFQDLNFSFAWFF
jgi:hypothetical protein